MLVGISSGATLAAIAQKLPDLPAGSRVLGFNYDTGERYLTTALFEDTPADMSDEEKEISRSTSNFRFDRPSPPAAAADPDDPVPVTDAARAFVEQTIGDRDRPVVMFSLEWCEFCWSLRKMFGEFAIPYRSIDLDSVAYQDGDWGGQIRAALIARTSFKTIPQIFVGGEFIGGCTDVFDAQRDGRLGRLLTENDVAFDESLDVDPYSFLPSWLHPR